MRSLFGERKRLRYGLFLIRTTRRNPTELSDHSNKHHTHPRTRSKHTTKQVFTPVHKVPHRKTTATLQVSSLTEDFTSLHRKQAVTSPFDSLRPVLFFLSFLSYCFCLLFLVFLPISLIISYFSFPSSLNQLLKKFSSCIPLYSVTASPSSFCHSPLSLKILSLAKFHKLFFAP